MIKTMNLNDVEFQALIADLETTGNGHVWLFENPDVVAYGLGHHRRVKSTRGVLREIQRAQHRGQYLITVETMTDGIEVSAYTALAHV